MKYHVYWENITDPRSFIYFILLLLLFILFYYLFYFIIIIILFYFILLIIYFLESQACLRFELHVFFTYKPVTKVGVIF